MLLMLKNACTNTTTIRKKHCGGLCTVTSVFSQQCLSWAWEHRFEFAKRVKALGAYTIGIKRDISNKPECIDEIYTLDKLDELIPRADVIALTVPNNPDTYKLMNEKRIYLMKQGAVLLNVGRGVLVDTDALNKALSEGRIMAGLDVTDPEPLPDSHPLWKQENCIITPHISGFFYLPKTLEYIVEIALDNMARYAEGKQLNNIIKS